MPEILLATRNPGKIREIRQMSAHTGWVWHSLEDFPQVPEATEGGSSFAENACRKALHCAQVTGLYTLADDSGLEVDALGGRPGVHSARYAGTPRDDDANNHKLVAALAGVPRERRTARFRCAMAFARPGRVLIETEGTVEGLIIDEPRGENGFGYDPHFLIPELGRTTAELPPDRKNALSHRGKALRAMLERIEAFLQAEAQRSG
jgi:XTP/dITP diphosphohydrolase